MSAPRLHDLALRTLSQERCDYHMANRTNAQQRYKKGVPTQGAGADFHYRGDFDWLWMSELARDLYRNNMILGSITDRAIENTLQGGFVYDPDTGDKRLDQDLKQWWEDESQDPTRCDPAGELTFSEQEEIVLRDTIVAGDIWALPLEDGTVDLIEGHRVRSPSRKTRERIVHGVEFVPGSKSRRRAAIWVLKDQIDPHKQNGILKGDLDPYLYWDDDGELAVFHVRFTKRVKQTRGITAYAPLFDVSGYHDDCQFLKMVQQRAASLFVFVRKRMQHFDPAYLAAEQQIGVDVSRDLRQEYETNRRQYREVAAGGTLEGLPGEDITPWSSNIPNAEFFAHSRMLLTFMGVNLGMPLVMSLMDASETNFSGYRGAIDQARMGFRANQRRLMRRFHVPYLRFKLFKRAENDPAFARQLERSRNPRTRLDVFRHKWNPPAWPYIEPGKDAAADVIRLANGLACPSRVYAERGLNYEVEARKAVDEFSGSYEYALQRALQLKAKFTEIEHVDPHVLALTFAKMPMPERTQISVSTDVSATDEPANPPEVNPDAQ